MWIGLNATYVSLTSVIRASLRPEYVERFLNHLSSPRRQGSSGQVWAMPLGAASSSAQRISRGRSSLRFILDSFFD